MVQTGNEVPEVRHVTRYFRRPSGMAIRQHLRRRRVLDAVRVGGAVIAGRADFEVMGCTATPVVGLHGERMNHGDQRHVRLLAKGEAQAKGAMRGQVANERVRQRLARIPSLFFRLLLGFVAAFLDAPIFRQSGKIVRPFVSLGNPVRLMGQMRDRKEEPGLERVWAEQRR